MANPKVSIIVPVYNAEKYLNICLESILKQTFKDLEVICVNDGSTDNSLDVLTEYVYADNRIKIINKPNSGYGNSMNIGIDAATGEYIGIVESDDYILEDMYATLYNIAEKNDVDVVKSDFYRFVDNDSGKEEKEYIFNSRNTNNVFCPADKPKVILSTTANWTGLYKREFLVKNNIRHNETPGASYQDIGFMIQTLVAAERVYFVDKAFYMYRNDNPNSSINSKSKVYCVRDEYEFIDEFLNQHQDLKKIFEKAVWVRRYNNYIFTYNRISDEFKAEFLIHFSSVFKHAYSVGKLDKDYFGNEKWNTLLRIIQDPETFNKEQFKIEKRKALIRSYGNKKIPIFRKTIWCFADHGAIYTIKRAIKKTIERAKPEHWSCWDAPKAHISIFGCRILKLFGLSKYNKRMRSIAEVKNRHVDDRCFIVCTGPSLRIEDLECLKNEHTFSMNTIFLAFENTNWRPTYYAFVDFYTYSRLKKHYDINFEEVCQKDAFLHSYIKTQNSDRIKHCHIHYGNHINRNLKKSKVKIENDVSLCIYDCFTVTNMAMTLAIYMGFKEIYIIGCDCNYDKAVHFCNSKIDPNGEKEGRWSQAVDYNIRGYIGMKKYAERKGVKVYNATRGGHLEVFERIDFDNIEFKNETK